MKALLVIDYTNDFVADKGALTCGAPAQAIEEEIARLVQEFLSNGDYVVFAVDKHFPGDAKHPENALFPPHNLEGTWGRQLFGQIETIYQANKDSRNVYYMDKTRYSSFVGTDLYLRLMALGVDDIHLCGVCTDICVLHTMVDGYNMGFSQVVHEKAVASFNPEGHRWALTHFKNSMGAKII